MIGITRAQYAEALDASDRLATASDLIACAVKQLAAVPERFRSDMWEAMKAPLDDGLAEALSKLADRVALDADAAAEASS